ncbi:1,2-phenylacetyl-CoA epoxidase subunit PaaA [Natribaculum luteum]|uniref:1,2-phenylacetyl-CoA epoxidase subunit PaaA n=1 Tax=Natribaculum luteum TaxID=1586232 RepID=A0ABD5NVT3_9EURY|nr:1,2-phenylacetyl-CoA epoxidase subunit PaaA [Natribaculum luteum]
MELEERIAHGDTIESGDELTDEYRNLVTGMIQFTANSELVGAFTERKWIPKAPSYHRKLALTAKVQDEIGHAQMQYRLAENLGNDREEMLIDLLEGRSGFGNAFHYHADEWIDIALIAWLIDGAAMKLQGSLLKTSYGPYQRVMRRICREEEFHVRHGEHIIREYATGSRAKQERLQEGINRWWPRGMMFFGLSDQQSEKTRRMVELGIKPKTNDELRQEYLADYVPKIRELGFEIPDDQIEYDDEADRWLYTDPDWEEFKMITTKGGPAIPDRLDRRQAAFDDTAWVRDALAAYHGQASSSRLTNNPGMTASD